MDHKTKADFILALHKHSLKAFADGGPTASGRNLIGDISGALTVTNPFQASTPTSIGTVGGQQAGLAGQLENEATGAGPNPAQIQYQQNAEQIAQSQATANAANRAINPGLAARLSGNQAVAAGQNAAAGAAQQQAEQQIAAQQQLQGLTGQEQTGALGAQQINAGTAQSNTDSTNKTAGGILSGIGSVIGSIFAKGGEVEKHEHLESVAKIYHPKQYAPIQKMASGGPLIVPAVPAYSLPSGGIPTGGSSSSGEAGSAVGGALGDLAGDFSPQTIGSATAGVGGAAGATAGGTALAGGADLGSLGDLAAFAAKGGRIPSKSEMHGKMAPASLMKKGGPVKAQDKSEKAKVKDDSLKNDKVPALLSEGEIVLPRHITQHPMAPEKAAEFVRATLNKRRMGKAS